MKRSLFSVMVLGLVLSICPSGYGEDSATCFPCHDPENFRGKVVHAPVKEGRCGECHAPHVARNKALLRDVESRLCFRCHKPIEQALIDSPFLHEPVSRGDCVTCHAAHASANRALLPGNLAQTCFACHPKSNQAYNVPHAPFMKGQCNACHAAHGAQDSRMIREPDPAVCLGCHQDKRMLKAKHLGREADTLACLKCHAPHGSRNAHLLRPVQHAPFREGKCRQCHERTNDPSLCFDCHSDVLQSFSGSHSHLQRGAGANICLSCHDAHVGDAAGMLPANLEGTCRTCHTDTFNRRSEMLHKHPQWSHCSACHQLHSSDRPAMLKGTPEEVCGQCHETHVNFTHPIGDRAVDPRNGLAMDCTSCHESNVGSLFRYHLRGGGERGLCIECHQSY